MRDDTQTEDTTSTREEDPSMRDLLDQAKASNDLPFSKEASKATNDALIALLGAIVDKIEPEKKKGSK